MTLAMLAMLLLGQDDKPVTEGKREFTSRCASCHFVPDAGLRSDRVWLGLIKTTA